MVEDTAPAQPPARAVTGVSVEAAPVPTSARWPLGFTRSLVRPGLRPLAVTALAGLAAILLFIFALRLLVVSAGTLGDGA